MFGLRSWCGLISIEFMHLQVMPSKGVLLVTAKGLYSVQREGSVAHGQVRLTCAC